jgi:hypothetical protein
MKRSIEKIDQGEQRLHAIRDQFVGEMMAFNSEFDFPRTKVEQVFDSAVRATKASKTLSKRLFEFE